MQKKVAFRKRVKINNLKLRHIAELVDAGVDPQEFNLVEELTNRYVFEHIPTGKLISIRRWKRLKKNITDYSDEILEEASRLVEEGIDYKEAHKKALKEYADYCTDQSNSNQANTFNNSVHLGNYIFKVGDKFKHENGVVGTIVGIDNDLINLSQHSAEYGYYPNITVTANILSDLLSRKQLIRIKEGENIGTIKQ